MSRENVADTIVSMVGKIGGIRACELGMPEMGMLGTIFPRAYIEVNEPRWQRMTMGIGGTTEAMYDVTVTLVLDIPDVTRQRAQRAALRFADRFRAAFAPDATLKDGGVGNAFDAELTAGTSNYPDFKNTGDHPHAQFTLVVREHAAYNSAAAD